MRDRPISTRPPMAFGSRSAQTPEQTRLEPLRIYESGRLLDGSDEEFEAMLSETGLEPTDAQRDEWRVLFRQAWRRLQVRQLRQAATTRRAS